jgi:hypothetical protein
MQQREENRRGLQVGQEDARILSLASTLNYLDYFPIIYRDRSQAGLGSSGGWQCG